MSVLSGGSESPTLDRSFLVATGSSDAFVYLYDVEQQEGHPIQKLEGHLDRVYAVDFHPQEPILCSGSADFTIKMWEPERDKP